MSKSLPARPNLDHLREQAKDLLSAFRAGDPSAVSRFSQALPGFASGRSLALHDAQSAIAREYGFSSWKELARHVEEMRAKEGITPEVKQAYVEALTSDRWRRADRLLELYPELPIADFACAIVSGEVEEVRRQLAANSSLASSEVEPYGLRSLELAAQSRIHRAGSDKSEAQLECVRLLLDHGADPNTRRGYGFPVPDGCWLTVLYDASGASGHVGVVRELLQRGANPNDGESLSHGAEHNRREILEVLAEFGADLSGRHPGWGITPLGFLSSFRETYATAGTAALGAEWLLEQGADPNITSGEHNETPLQIACRQGRVGRVVEALVAHGADVNARRDDGRTPYASAAMAGNRQAMEILVRAGAYTELSPDERFLAACAAGDEGAIKEMLSADPSLIDRTEIEAADLFRDFGEFGDDRGLRGLFVAGYAFTREEGTGKTALHFAAFAGWHTEVAFLLACGASPLARDDEHNSTPFGWAAYGATWNRNPKGDYPATVRLLLEAGTPQDIARAELDYEEVPEDVKIAIRDFLER